MADAVGVDTKTLFKMVENGQIDPNIYLPKLAEEMAKKAAQGEGKWRGSLGYQQDLAAVLFEEQVRKSGEYGGSKAFLNIWTEINRMLSNSDSLARAFGQTMEWASEVFAGFGDIVVLSNDALSKMQKLSPELQDGLTTAGAAVLLAWSPWLRAMSAAYLVLEDFAGYRQGKKSVTGMLLNGEGVADDPKFDKFSGRPTRAGLEWLRSRPLPADSPYLSPTFQPADPLMDINKIKVLLDKDSSLYSMDNLTGVPNYGLGNSSSKSNTFNIEINHTNGNGEEIWGIFKNKLIELDANNPVGE